MPELPEVKTVVSKLNNVVCKTTIEDVEVRLKKLIKNKTSTEFIESLIGKKILYVENIGKFIVFHLSSHIVIVSHLRMEGKYRFQMSPNFKKHDHIIFSLNSGYLIYSDTRQFGTFHIFHEKEYLEQLPISKLAQEPGETDIDWLFSRLSKKTVSIKTALLDQSLIVGLGNIYVDEVLWDTKINPKRKSCDISFKKLKEILKSSQKILDKATQMGGTTIHSFEAFNGEEGRYQTELNVHGKEHQKCQRCGKKIVKIKVNGRGTYFCPNCQKN